MNINNKSSYWVVLILAVGWIAVEVFSYVNYADEPDPKWTRLLSLVIQLILLGIVYSILKNKSDSNP
ncbi:hypothetical protein NT6N_24200 [Oceaniferula spumae]|uniref:Uncharacterized protein n=1 Tax=Oceaniferula spumae TaxID=2979115 RepID=A0AAT9FN15_9BACT